MIDPGFGRDYSDEPLPRGPEKWVGVSRTLLKINNRSLIFDEVPKDYTLAEGATQLITAVTNFSDITKGCKEKVSLATVVGTEMYWSAGVVISVPASYIMKTAERLAEFESLSQNVKDVHQFPRGTRIEFHRDLSEPGRLTYTVQQPCFKGIRAECRIGLFLQYDIQLTNSHRI